LKLVEPKIKIISINLGRTLFFDVLFSRKCHPHLTPLLLKPETEITHNVLASSLIFIEAENYSLLKNLQADLFINIASMQEMDPKTIKKYFEYMRMNQRSPRYFYCCNRIRKELPDGTVTEFMKFPWNENDTILLDEICPWYQKYPSSKPPFWRSFDGPIHHRLIKMN